MLRISVPVNNRHRGLFLKTCLLKICLEVSKKDKQTNKEKTHSEIHLYSRMHTVRDTEYQALNEHEHVPHWMSTCHTEYQTGTCFPAGIVPQLHLETNALRWQTRPKLAWVLPEFHGASLGDDCQVCEFRALIWYFIDPALTGASAGRH